MKKMYAKLLGMIIVVCAITFISCVEEEGPVLVPKKPGILPLEIVSSSSIRVAWVDSSDNEDGFTVERARLDSFYFVPVVTLPANSTSFLDTGLISLTNYAYRVRAFNGAGVSLISSIRVAMTPRPSVPPNIPLSVRAVAIGDAVVYLSWQDNSTDEIGFRIERSIAGANSFFGIDTVGANIDNYQDRNVTASTSYEYRIRAYNSIGSSAYTSAVTVTPGNRVVAPAAPSNLIAAPVSATQISVTWKDNSVNETSFIVERAPIGTELFNVIATLSTGASSYRDKNLAPSTGYSYRVRAHNSVGYSTYSEKGDAVTLPVTSIPTAPSGLVASPKSATQIWLDWIDNSDDEDGFYIERAIGTTGNYTVIQTVVANEISFRATGLNSSTSYSFRVRAFNTSGTSAYSNTITRTTPPLQTPPGSPNTLQILEITAEKIKMKWKAENVTNEDGFQIERRQARSSNFVQIAQVSVNETEYEDFEVLSSTEYSYRIRAYNLLGTSNYTNTVIAETKSRTETNFINSSSYPIISLTIDGTQYFSYPQQIASGNYWPVQVNTGRHTYTVKNGYWDGLAPVILYSDSGQFIQQADVSGSVIFTDPTIFQIITKFRNSANWQATYVFSRDSLGNVDSVGTARFQFFANGTYSFYNNNALGGSGLYSVKQYGTNLTVVFNTEKGEATMNEDPRNNYFTLRNGPAGQEVLTYYYLPSP